MRRYIAFEEVRRMWKVGPVRTREHLRLHGVVIRKGQYRSISREEVMSIPPPGRIRKSYSEDYEPTPEEIRQACQQIQAGWTDEERAKRHVGDLSESPIFAYRFLGMAFEGRET